MDVGQAALALQKTEIVEGVFFAGAELGEWILCQCLGEGGDDRVRGLKADGNP